MAHNSFQRQWAFDTTTEKVQFSPFFTEAENRESNRTFKGAMEEASFSGSSGFRTGSSSHNNCLCTSQLLLTPWWFLRWLPGWRWWLWWSSWRWWAPPRQESWTEKDPPDEHSLSMITSFSSKPKRILGLGGRGDHGLLPPGLHKTLASIPRQEKQLATCEFDQNSLNSI